MAITRTVIPLEQLTVNSGAALLDPEGNEILEFEAGLGSAANHILISNRANSATGFPAIHAKGVTTNVGLDIGAQGTGTVNFIANATSSGGIRLFEDGNAPNFVGIRAPELAANYTLTLPTSAGTGGYALCVGSAAGEHPLVWKEALVDGGAFGSLTLTDAGGLLLDSAGDAFIKYDVDGSVKWSVGVDDSQGDQFAFCTGSTLTSASAVLWLTTSGAVFTKDSIHVGAAGAGSPSASLYEAGASVSARLVLHEGIDNGANSVTVATADAIGGDRVYTMADLGANGNILLGLSAAVLPANAKATSLDVYGAAGGGDKVIKFSTGDAADFVIGIDDDDSESFKIHSSTALAGNSDFEITTGGEIAVNNGSITLAGGCNISTAGYLKSDSLHLQGGGSAAGHVYFMEDSDNGTNKLRLLGPAQLGAAVDADIPAAGGTLMTVANMQWGELSQTIAGTSAGGPTKFKFIKQGAGNKAAMVFLNGLYQLPTNGGEHVTGKATSGSAGGLCLDAAADIAYGETVAASAADDNYNNWYIHIAGGTGIGQTRQITDYVASPRSVAVAPVFGTPPDNTSVYVLVQNDVTFISKEVGSATGCAVAYFTPDINGNYPQDGSVVYANYQRLGSSAA